MVSISRTNGTFVISIFLLLNIVDASIGSVAFLEPETTYAQRSGKYMKQTGVTLPKV